MSDELSFLGSLLANEEKEQEKKKEKQETTQEKPLLTEEIFQEELQEEEKATTITATKEEITKQIEQLESQMTKESPKEKENQAKENEKEEKSIKTNKKFWEGEELLETTELTEGKFQGKSEPEGEAKQKKGFLASLFGGKRKAQKKEKPPVQEQKIAKKGFPVKGLVFGVTSLFLILSVATVLLLQNQSKKTGYLPLKTSPITGFQETGKISQKPLVVQSNQPQKKLPLQIATKENKDLKKASVKPVKPVSSKKIEPQKTSSTQKSQTIASVTSKQKETSFRSNLEKQLNEKILKVAQLEKLLEKSKSNKALTSEEMAAVLNTYRHAGDNDQVKKLVSEIVAKMISIDPQINLDYTRELSWEDMMRVQAFLSMMLQLEKLRKEIVTQRADTLQKQLDLAASIRSFYEKKEKPQQNIFGIPTASPNNNNNQEEKTITSETIQQPKKEDTLANASASVRITACLERQGKAVVVTNDGMVLHSHKEIAGSGIIFEGIKNGQAVFSLKGHPEKTFEIACP